MLTPLPAILTPVPPGTQSLPLPHGAETGHGLRLPHPLLPPQAGTTLPSGSQPRLASGAAPPPLPLPEEPGQGPPRAVTVALPETTLGSAISAPPGSVATPMSLIAAQMQGMDIAAMQAMLAQQAATRALPHGAARRTEPHHDAPPDPTAAAPGDSFDPHAPHPPQVLPHHPGAPALDETPAPPPAPGKEPRKRKPPPPPQFSDPLTPPPAAALRPPTPWVLAGAVFVGVFLLVVLSF